VTLGPVALHGGGEFLPGDEPFLAALLRSAVVSARAGPSDDGEDPRDAPIRVAIVPTAAARGRPALAAATGERAFRRVALEIGLAVQVDAVLVVDGVSAASADEAGRLAIADLIYLPGGDPDVIPALLPDSRALRSIEAARGRGAVVAGASAGAMALAAWTWTPAGGTAGLGLVPGMVVVPHFDPRSAGTFGDRLAAGRPAGLGVLGLAERTGVVSPAAGAGETGGAWAVHGRGLVHWYPPGSAEPVVGRDGDEIVLRA
jgi:cyanophycinase-like exopeptidase